MAAKGVADPLAELWNHTMAAGRSDLFCFDPTRITMMGIWTGENPLDFSIPLLLFQIILITATTRAVALLLAPLRLPRYISEILAGFLLGPSVLGRVPHFSDIAFPVRSIFILESMSLIGLVYYTFTIGVEIELHTILRAGFRSFWFAAASALPPFLVGAVTGYLALSGGGDDNGSGRQTATSNGGQGRAAVPQPPLLPRLPRRHVRNIAELKLAGTDVDQFSISASLINDTFVWVGLSVATALARVRYGMVPCASGPWCRACSSSAPATWWFAPCSSASAPSLSFEHSAHRRSQVELQFKHICRLCLQGESQLAVITRPAGVNLPDCVRARPIISLLGTRIKHVYTPILASCIC